MTDQEIIDSWEQPRRALEQFCKSHDLSLDWRLVFLPAAPIAKHTRDRTSHYQVTLRKGELSLPPIPFTKPRTARRWCVPWSAKPAGQSAPVPALTHAEAEVASPGVPYTGPFPGTDPMNTHELEVYGTFTERIPPTLVEVMDHLGSNARDINFTVDFKGWCEYRSIDPGSPNSRREYDEGIATAVLLRSFLGEPAYAQLFELAPL